MENILEKVHELSDRIGYIYIYGAGIYGRNIYGWLKNRDVKIDGFLVTKNHGENTIDNVPIEEADSVIWRKDVGVIIAANPKNKEEILHYLNCENFPIENVIIATGIMDKEGKRGIYHDFPVMEITTKIGCSVRCKFCPQSILIRQYY